MRKISCIILISLIAMSSCNRDSLNKRNPNDLTPDNYFKNAEELTRAVNSIYAIIQGNSLVAREYFFLHDLRSDDCASGGGQLEVPRNALLIGAQQPDNAVSNEVWNGLYRTIFRANTVINLAPGSVDANSATVKRLVAEAKFLRAWAYHELVTQWGGVPIYTVIPTSGTQTQPRFPEDSVYALIKNDLTQAELDLPTSYSGAELGRATRGAAQMLLAKIYMIEENYQAARSELSKIINSGVYALTNEYTDNFREENEWNQESVFEIGFASIGDVNWESDGDDPSWGDNETTTRTQEYSPVGWRNVIPSNSLIAEYESEAKGDEKTDPRRSMSIYVVGDSYNNGESILTDDLVQGNTSIVDGQETKASWAKYAVMYKMDPGGYFTSGINQRLMRYAESILMMAECENELGNLALAISYLNQIRNRPSVSMPNYPTTSFPCSNKEEVFKAITHEKRVELSGEQVRNRDILRWLRNGKISTGPISNFNPLLPIPQEEIDNNDKIADTDQNPGY
jgi:hypothetical protein